MRTSMGRVTRSSPSALGCHVLGAVPRVWAELCVPELTKSAHTLGPCETSLRNTNEGDRHRTEHHLPTQPPDHSGRPDTPERSARAGAAELLLSRRADDPVVAEAADLR